MSLGLPHRRLKWDSGLEAGLERQISLALYRGQLAGPLSPKPRAHRNPQGAHAWNSYPLCQPSRFSFPTIAALIPDAWSAPMVCFLLRPPQSATHTAVRMNWSRVWIVTLVQTPQWFPVAFCMKGKLLPQPDIQNPLRASPFFLLRHLFIFNSGDCFVLASDSSPLVSTGIFSMERKTLKRQVRKPVPAGSKPVGCMTSQIT